MGAHFAREAPKVIVRQPKARKRRVKARREGEEEEEEPLREQVLPGSVPSPGDSKNKRKVARGERSQPSFLMHLMTTFAAVLLSKAACVDDGISVQISAVNGC